MNSKPQNYSSAFLSFEFMSFMAASHTACRPGAHTFSIIINFFSATITHHQRWLAVRPGVIMWRQLMIDEKVAGHEAGSPPRIMKRIPKGKTSSDIMSTIGFLEC
jgi:hypothetical protein